MKKLCQVIAIDSGVKKKVHEKTTELHKASQKADLFAGLSRKYQPRNDDPSTPLGELLPDENKKIVMVADDLLRDAASTWTELFDITATREWGNCGAKASVEIDGKVLLADVPVTYLLFLEKQLDDVRKFVDTIPTLDPSEDWEQFQPGQWRSKPTQSVRTKKVSRVLELAPATQQHPAQVKEITEDVQAGTWTAIKFSSALPPGRKQQFLDRVEAARRAVKFAREQANTAEVNDQRTGKAVFDYLFA